MDERDVIATAESADEATAEATRPELADQATAEATAAGPQTTAIQEEQTADVGMEPRPVEEPASAEEPTPRAEEPPPAAHAEEPQATEAAAPPPALPSEEPAPLADEPEADEAIAPQLVLSEQAPRQRPTIVQPRAAALPRHERPRTKLVCTIGPATIDRIRELVDTGLDVARINFSHGSAETHKAAIDSVRAAAHHARRSVAVMVDLPGPKIRLGEIDGDELELQAGLPFLLRRPGGAQGAGTDRAADVSRDNLAQLLQAGDRVLLADGAAELRVTAIAADGAGVESEVVRGGTIRSRSGVNIPSERLSGPALTAEDHEAVPRALAMRPDIIAQSFVRSAADVAELRELLPAGNAPLIVAKIETRAGVDNFDEIAAVSDGVMVARGDLGVDLPFEEVPLIQKDLVRRGQVAGRFTIVATQMLESMTAAPRPTRAEASDVANAVLDGVDAVMLSAETAIGMYPLEAARARVSICTATERNGSAQLRALAANGGPPTDDQQAIARAALMLANSYPTPTAIWCFTRTGRTAEMLSVLRPLLPVVAFTLSPVVARRLAPLHAVVPVVLSAARTGEPLIRRMEAAARAQHVIGTGQSSTVVLVTTSGQADGVNRLELHQV